MTDERRTDAGSEPAGPQPSSPWERPAVPPSDPWSQPAGSAPAPWPAPQYPDSYDRPEPTQPLPAVDAAPTTASSYDDPGWTSYPSQGYAVPATQAPRRKGAGVALVAAMALAGLAGGGIGTAVTLARTDDNNTATTTSTTAPDSVAPVTAGVTTAPVAPPVKGSINEIARQLIPSVVEIDVETTQGGGSGSGVVISADGYILTNNHVVEDAVQIKVRLVKGKADATIVGTDPLTDLAVIKVQSTTPLKPAPLGTSETVQVGDPVIAIGSPLGLAGTVTSGIVSALDRKVDVSQTESLYNMIQTDAAINPGNSGGALLDASGRVIGINSAIATLGQSLGGQGGSIGLGFAIPIDLAKETADQLIKTGRVVHPQLGVRVNTIDDDRARELNLVPGALVVLVEPGSPAANAGIQVDDIITSINGKPLSGGDDLVTQIRTFKVGDRVKVTVNRKGKPITVETVLAERPRP
jgi:putative serine protease PepD